MNFMAVEVDYGDYLFLTMDDNFSDDDDEGDEKAMTPFHYNPLHDMESISWIIIHFILNKERSLPSGAKLNASVPSATAEAVRIALEAEDRQFAESLFYTQAARIASFSEAGIKLRKATARLPDRLKRAGRALLNLRAALIERYRAYENSGMQEPKNACTAELYGLFSRKLAAIQQQLEESGDIIVSPRRPSSKDVKQYAERARKAFKSGIPPGGPCPAACGSNNKRKAKQNLTTGSMKKVRQ